MSVGKLLETFGPTLLEHVISQQEKDGNVDVAAFLRADGFQLLAGLCKALDRKDQRSDALDKAAFVASLARDLLQRPGHSATDEGIADALRIAKRIADGAEALCLADVEPKPPPISHLS